MKKMDMIFADKIGDLAETTFAQKTSVDSAAVYTEPLTKEEEVAVVTQMIKGQKREEWKKFLEQYLLHYELSNDAVKGMLSHPEQCLDILLILYDKHSSSPTQLCFFCKEIQEKGITSTADRLLNIMISKSLYHDDLANALLSQIDSKAETNYAELYAQALHENRKKNELLNLFS